MATARIIFADPRYNDFLERYHADPYLFCVEVCMMIPSEDQKALLDAVAPPTARVSVASGTTTGKTMGFGRIALWNMLCHPMAQYEGKTEIGSNTYVGGPNVKTVAEGVMKEIHDARAAIYQGPFAWINVYWAITATKVYIKGFESQWFIAQMAMQKGQAVGVAGKHRYWQMIIVDEAAGVPDEHFKVINGTQTQGGNRTLLASQGVRNAGFFYETHHNLCKANGGAWDAIRMSSENSPFATLDWLKSREFECGGRDSFEYKVRVRGLFAENEGETLLTRSQLESAFKPRRIIADDEPYGLIILADVGAGEYRDDSVAVVAKIIGSADHGDDARRVEYIRIPLCTNSKDEINFSGELADLFNKTTQPTLYVDSGGIGGTVVKLLVRSGIPVVPVAWGAPCFSREYQDRYFNLRACAMVRFRDAVRQGRVVLPQNIDEQVKQKILLQGARLPYHFSEAGKLRYQMMSKDKMREEGIKSPDIIDAMSFAFLEGTTYIPLEKDPDQHLTARGKAVDKLQAEMEAALGLEVAA